MHRRRLLAGAVLTAAGPLAGCLRSLRRQGGGADGGGGTDGGGEDGRGTAAPPPTPVPGAAAHGYTYLRPGGNRVVGGTGRLPAVEPADVPLPARPEWVVGAPDADGTVWAAVLADGRVRGFRVRDGTVSERTVAPAETAAPPILAVAYSPRLLVGGSTLTHPVPTPGETATVRPDGALAFRGSFQGVTLLDALPDARPAVAGDRLYVLAGPTESYGHGVLGDAVEATAVAVVDARDGSVLRRLEPPAGTVIEGIAPIVAPLGGERAVVVTASDGSAGARLVAFREDGRRLVGPPVGSGFRWRHGLAVAPFGPDGGRELAVVRTPHIGGVAEFYRPEGGGLELAATLSGYSSHAVGSRNLDGAAAGRFDGGAVKLLVPTDARDELAALGRSGDGVREAWRLPVGGDLTTNLAAVPGPGGIQLAAGHAGGLRFWVS